MPGVRGTERRQLPSNGDPKGNDPSPSAR
jgi:hypothetical protein